MSGYLVTKSVLMILLLVGGFGLFFWRVRRLYRLMRAVRGTVEQRFDRLRERVMVLLTDVLGQSNVRRKQPAGWAHTLIFFGFLAVQPHSLELMIRGVFPGFGFEYWMPGIYGVYLFAADVLAFLVLFGLAYALYRRLFVKPAYLTDGRDARLIILFTAVVIVSFHFVNAFQLQLSTPGHAFNYAAAFTVSEATARLFSLNTLSAAARHTGYEIAYWIHILTILGFLVYIPGSKHLHLLAAVPNVVLKPLEKTKAMIKTDIEDETAERFGLGSVGELNWKNVLDLYACTECGRCEEQCPASTTEKPLSPKKLVADVKHDLFDQADVLLANAGKASEAAAPQPLVRETSPITSDVIWSCTSCRACENICPVNIQHLDLLLEIRKQRVLMEADFPPELQETFTNLENQSNPWGFSADTRADWCRDMDIPLMSDHPEAELLYFVGCAGSFDDRGKKIATATARVLKKAGVDFAILGPEERCNGDMARRAGNEYLAQMMIMENVETLNQYKPRRILTGCPHCYNILKNEYPQFGAVYPVVHHTQLFDRLIRKGRLKINNGHTNAVAYHDSCYLGRWNQIYDEPRRILTALGAVPRELNRQHDLGFCCGAGGARMFMEETLGSRINHERAREIKASGIGCLATACPFCTTMLGDGLTDLNADMPVRDIAEILDEATG